ncbi:MAG: cyclase family protein [Candidatus Omnitrophota bacterium]|nr:cyclase family protein [Candidatus Omnitrophota bacterium]
MRGVGHKKWIDVTVPICHGMISWPSDPPVEISRYKCIGRNGQLNNVALLKMGSHTGTHIDAPRHFLKDGLTVDAMSPELMVGPVNVIQIKDPVAVRAAQLKDQGIRPGQRIILKTRNSSTQWWHKGFNKDFVYLTLEAAEFLASRRVKLVGIDYLSVGGYKHEDGGKVHKALLERGICIVEGLALCDVRPGLYDIMCLPMKIGQGDGAPARVLLRKKR